MDGDLDEPSPDDGFDQRLLDALTNPPPYEPFPTFADFESAVFDSTTVDQFSALMIAAKDAAGEDQLAASVRKATKWAAVDTGAIEGLYEVERGFTFSVAASAAAWDNMHAHIGQPAKRAIDDALEAYDYVLDVATESRPITEAWIKELHQVICRSQETYSVVTPAGRQEHHLEKGVYKKYPNNPLNYDSASVHPYAPVQMTPQEMHRFVEQLRDKDFLKAHPVKQAAYAHYAYVCVHPFADGNGRVARALASAYLYRSPGVPLVIFADQKPAYIESLVAADGGSFDLFLSFISERAIDVVRMVTDDLRRPARPPLAEQMAAMQSALMGRGGLPHNEVDALGSLLTDEINAAIHRVLEKSPISEPLSTQVTIESNPINLPSDSYRVIPNPRVVNLMVKVSGVGATSGAVNIGVAVAKGRSIDIPDFIVSSSFHSEPALEVLIRDLKPTVSPSLTYRLDAVVEDILADLVDRVVAESRKLLRNSGYS